MEGCPIRRQRAERPRSDAAGIREPSRMEARMRPPLTHAPRWFGRALIRLYRYTLSPLIGFHCRHLPTCSEFGDEALDRFGLWAGGWMTLARLSRCHPWGTSGIDRVPAQAPVGARWYLPWRFGRWSWRQADDR